MPHPISRRSLLMGMSSVSALAMLSGCSSGPRATDRSEQLVWSTYGVGTGTYNDLAAVANTLTGRTGRQIRLMTSDTGIGRLAPLINGTAQYSRAGDEYYYAFEGNDEFTSENWGPQPIRLVWTPPGNYGVLVRKDSGIEKVEDLKGKKYPRLVASTSMNRKLEGILNYGGLTGSDVEFVDISYGGQIEGLKTGQIDALYQNVVGANIEELASQYPVHWLDLGGNDQSKYETWEELAPMVRPGRFVNGAGMNEGESAVNMQYTIPLTTLAERPGDEVTRLVTALDENFEYFKSATPDAKNFAFDRILLEPLVVPFHDSMVEFLKQKKRWTPGLQQRNDALLERERLMMEQWPGFWEENGANDTVRTLWVDWKRENLPTLPPINDVPEPSENAGAA